MKYVVVPQRNTLVLACKEREKVLNIFPTAKAFEYKGKQLIALPHKLDEVRVLNNLGVAAPAPILHYYKWPGRYTPMETQRQAAAFLTMNPRAFNLSDMGCVDSETEYLTATGWKKISTYAGGEVAQYHPSTGSIEFVVPSAYIKLPCDDMIRLKTSRGVDQLLSPEHRVLYAAHDGGIRVSSAAEVLQTHEQQPYGWKGRIITTFLPPTTGGIPLTDAQLRLQVAVMADGHIPNGTPRTVMRLKKLRKKIRLRQLLSEANVLWTERDPEYASAPGFTVFNFNAPIKAKSYGDWAWAASSDQLRVIADECPHWDGSQRKKNAVVFFTRDKPSADFIQFAFAATGRTASLITTTRENGVDYTVHARDRAALLWVCGTNAGVKSETITRAKATDGFKYCFSVPSTFLLLRRNGCIFATGNSGKTVATLWAYDYLRSIGLLKSALITAPLSTLERAWGDEIFKHFPHLTFSVLHGAKQRRLKLLEQRSDIYIVNHDGVEIIAKEVAARQDIGLLVIDEVAVFRNAATDRYKSLFKLADRPNMMVWGMTGTPIPNAPTDAWAQIRLIDKTRVTKHFAAFRDSVMTKVSQFKWSAKPNAVATVQAAMQPAIRFTREQCVELPPTTFTTYNVELSPEQKTAYGQMKNRMRMEYESGQAQAVNEADKTSKLAQIACGSVLKRDGEPIFIPAKARVALVKELIEQCGSKVLVFVPFIAALKSLHEELSKDWPFELVYGGTSKTDRDAAFDRLQNAPLSECRGIVANPAAMAHGLTLTAANTIIWFAPTNSHEVFDQANHRIIRTSQKQKTLIAMIEGSPVERKAYARLQARQEMQGMLLELFNDNDLQNAENTRTLVH